MINRSKLVASSSLQTLSKSPPPFRLSPPQVMLVLRDCTSSRATRKPSAPRVKQIQRPATREGRELPGRLTTIVGIRVGIRLSFPLQLPLTVFVVVEVTPNRDVEPVQRTLAPRVQAPVTILNSNADPQPQPPTLEASAWTRQPVHLPTPQQQFIPQPAANTLLPTIPVGPTHTVRPVMQGPLPTTSAPVQPPMPTASQPVPPSWLQQQAVISLGSYFHPQPMVPLVIVTPPPHVPQPTFAPVLTHHHNESESDDGMDIVDDDGDSWMRPSGFGEATAPPEPAPVPLVRTLVIPPKPAPALTIPPGPARVSLVQTLVTPPEPAPAPPVQSLVIPPHAPVHLGQTLVVPPNLAAPAPPVQTLVIPPGPAPVPLVASLVIPPELTPAPSAVQAPMILPGPAPAPLVSTLAIPPVQAPVIPIPAEGAPLRTHVIGPAQQSTIGPTWGLLDPNAHRLCKKVRASRLPYGLHPSVAPLAPSLNRWVGRLRRSVQTRRRGSTYTRHSTRNKDIARASMLGERSLLRKKIAARGPKPRCLEKPTLLRFDDQPTAANPTALVDSSSVQKKPRTYYDRLRMTRASPFSQRGPSEVSVLARRGVPELTSFRKAFILQRHSAARDRRAAGIDGRVIIIHQNDLAAGHQTVTGPHQQPALVQRRTPVSDHVYPRRKRKTAADYIRAEDAEKEKEILDAATDALQSMGLNSEASAPAPSSSTSTADLPASNPVPVSATVTQDPEFNQDQAQLFLEDIFEGCENKQAGLAPSFSSSSSLPGSSSDPDSDSGDD